MFSVIPQAMADRKSNPFPFIQASNHSNSLSEQAAVAIAKQHVDGRVLAINRVDNAYRIKILSNKGTVHIVTVNSKDGSISFAH